MAKARDTVNGVGEERADVGEGEVEEPEEIILGIKLAAEATAIELESITENSVS